MKKIAFMLLAFGLLSCSKENKTLETNTRMDITQTQNTSLHSFKVDGLEGGIIDFSAFKGKKVLIVNVASECGYTPQYGELQKLHVEANDRLVIVGFPANNFGKQEPGSNEEIKGFCERNYGVTFPMAAKVSVKGSDIHPLFKWLTTAENKDFKGDINWNFEKFLVDENGQLIRRYRSGVKPMSEEIISSL